jgi:holo-ACP synthase/triphosphoribosyl-dephospho-CoA synthase
MKARLVHFDEAAALETCDDAGDLFLAPVLSKSPSPPELKQLCEEFEENHPLGRFLDVDMTNEQGNPISSGKSKLCFFCRVQPAISCRRHHSHDIGELRSFMFSKMQAYCRSERESILAKRVSSLALKSLLHEISLSPKPGLVDRFSNGSHTDMSFLTFVDSTAAIATWFDALVRLGFSFHETDLTRALPAIRAVGLRMEKEMFDTTGNINTQKGIIFLMGLSLFACGKIFGQSDHFEEEQFRWIVGQVCKDMVGKEFGGIPRIDSSHGEEIFHAFGYSGARGEAESGFQTVFEFGLPWLERNELADDEAMTRCLLSIAAHNNDTNILYRRGKTVLMAFQELCHAALADFSEASYKAVIDYCKDENISPGGSADLLAISIFVRSVRQADQNASFPPLIPLK